MVSHPIDQEHEEVVAHWTSEARDAAVPRELKRDTPERTSSEPDVPALPGADSGQQGAAAEPKGKPDDGQHSVVGLCLTLGLCLNAPVWGWVRSGVSRAG